MAHRHHIDGSLTIKQWCDVKGKGSKAQLARLAGTTWKTIDSLYKGGRCRSPELAMAIELGTERAIRAEVVLGLPHLRKQGESMLKKAGVIEDFRLLAGPDDGRARLR